MRVTTRLAQTLNASKLTESLARIGISATSRGRKAESIREADVVGEQLCDDVIEYLAPTLEQHKGCTIIDVHPGACLFSSKLHDYLRPKWHLLMEPEEKYHEPFVKPLLDQPGSTYHHTILSGANPTAYFMNYTAIQTDPSLLPPRPSLPNDDPRKRQLDPSILVIGNLARFYSFRKRSRYLDYAPLVLHQMVQGALGNALFHTNGLVRMLWWIPEMYKFAVHSGTQAYDRRAGHVNLDMGANISEVAGVKSLHWYRNHARKNWVPRSRIGMYDAMHNQVVATKMQELGMSVPKGRQIQDSERNHDLHGQKVHVKNPLTIDIDDFSALQDKVVFVSERLKGFSRTGFMQIRNRKLCREATEALEYPQCQPVAKSVSSSSRGDLQSSRVAVLVDLGLKVINLEANFQELNEKSGDRVRSDQLRNALLKLDQEFIDYCDSAPVWTQRQVSELLEDELTVHNPQIFHPWDRRSYEPLQADMSDFYPETTLALYDVTPKTRDLSVPDLADRIEASKVCSDLLKHIFGYSFLALPATLDRIAVNAGKDLIPMVPAITDARKGGRLNPNNLKARMVTDEMIEGLVKAFFEWPFRPQNWELTVGSNTAEEGAVEEQELEEAAEG